MSEDTKKHQQKGKNEPKDQRRRRGRQQAAPIVKKVEKEPEQPKVQAPEKPAYEPPPPEFYKSLKRETDEILKITEEANSKYKKKEIQSNWAKYEMPVETYEEIDELENIGADYEVLSQAPLAVGAHFQFKHEKSWDVTTGPSPYDKYFDINMDNFSIALSTIPFYERNGIDIKYFNDNDVQSMNHRASKYKYKYYNDKKFITSEIEAQDKILCALKSDNVDLSDNETINSVTEDKNYKMLNQLKDIKLEDCEEPQTIKNKEFINVSKNADSNVEIFSEDKNAAINDTAESSNLRTEESLSETCLLEHEDNTDQIKELNKTTKESENIKISNSASKSKSIDRNKSIDNDFEDEVKRKELKTEKKPEVLKSVELVPKKKEPPNAPSLQKEPSPAKHPVIESPEDLEKWLDDFLDG